MSSFLSPQLATIDEAAQQLGVSAKTIRRYIAAGTLSAVRIGPRLIRVDLASVANLGTPIAWAGKR